MSSHDETTSSTTSPMTQKKVKLKENGVVHALVKHQPQDKIPPTETDDTRPMRLFVRFYGQSNKNVPSKVVAVHKNWAWETLLHKLGQKFDVIVGDVYLEFPNTNQHPFQIEQIDELKDGDHLYITGVLKSVITQSPEELELIEHKKSSSSLDSDLSSELNMSILKLTSQLSRLITRLDKQESNVAHIETLAKQLAKSSELNNKQFTEIMQAIHPHERPVVSVEERKNSRPPPKMIENRANILEFHKVTTFSEHTGPLWVLEITSDLLVSGSSDKTIKLWDLTSMKLIKTLEGHTGIVHCVAVHKGKLMSGSDDKCIRVWSLNEYKCINALYGHDNTICEMATTDKYLFSGSYNIIHVWNIDTFQFLTTLSSHNHWVYSMCVFNNHLFAGSHNMVKIWDIESLACVKTLMTGNKGGKSIYSLAVAGDYLLAGTYENSILVWNLKSYEIVKTLNEHQGCVLSLTVQGQFFFSGSYDTTIKVYNLDTLHVVDTLHHQAKVEALVATDKYIISGGTDNTIKIWSWKKRPVQQ